VKIIVCSGVYSSFLAIDTICFSLNAIVETAIRSYNDLKTSMMSMFIFSELKLVLLNM